MKTPVVALCTLLLLAPGAALAQAEAIAVDDPEATLLSDLIVIAPTEGPAWWRVSKGDSVVWIMGLPDGPTPKDMAWDRAALERRLKGANALLIPPGGSFTMTGEKVPITRMLPGLRWTNGNVEEAMTPALAARFARARSRIGKPARRYATPIPATAFVLLYADALRRAKLQGNSASVSAQAAAKRLKVTVLRAPTIKAGNLTLAQVAPARPEAAACFNALLDAAEAPAERYRAVAAGWARGDLRTAVSGPRDPFSICDNRLFNQGGSRRAIESQVAAIEKALTRPGKAVALAHLRPLLADEGILDRLAAKGYHIVYPTSMSEAD